MVDVDIKTTHSDVSDEQSELNTTDLIIMAIAEETSSITEKIAETDEDRQDCGLLHDELGEGEPLLSTGAVDNNSNDLLISPSTPLLPSSKVPLLTLVQEGVMEERDCVDVPKVCGTHEELPAGYHIKFSC